MEAAKISALLQITSLHPNLGRSQNLTDMKSLLSFSEAKLKGESSNKPDTERGFTEESEEENINKEGRTREVPNSEDELSKSFFKQELPQHLAAPSGPGWPSQV